MTSSKLPPVMTSVPVAAYGFVLGMAAVGYTVLQRALVACNGPDSLLRAAIGKDWKGKASLGLYAVAVALAFVSPWIAVAIYVAILLMWLAPDRRIEKRFAA